MTADTMGPAEVPDAVTAELASDLVAIVGHLVAQPGTAGPTGRQGRVHPADVMNRPATGQAPGVVKVRLEGFRRSEPHDPDFFRLSDPRRNAEPVPLAR